MISNILKYYAGIGSRQTPANICQIMTALASKLEKMGYTLRSGGALGADQSFERGVIKPENKCIYYPKKIPSIGAQQIASEIHPAWDRCNGYARECHGRNVYQILGESLCDPVEFVICWTPKAEAIGGTRTAIVLAEKYDIPIFNLADENALNFLKSFLSTNRG